MTNIYSFTARDIDGKDISLSTYKGRVLLIVNVASKCGFTGQYSGLERLYRDYKGEGLVVLGFPANNFLGQEPGSDEEIKQFCSLTYDVTFPLFSKITVVGPDIHPLYAALIAARPAATGEGPWRTRLEGAGIPVNPAPGILWNFEKFVIGKDGQVVARFSPDTPADNPALLAALEAALAA